MVQLFTSLGENMTVSKKQNIVTIHNDAPVAGTYLIAQGFDRKHKYILELINKHLKYFENFGGFKRQKIKTKGRAIEEYLLNEDQVMFLGTLLRNSETVILFKHNLVKEFSKIRRQLNALQAHQSTDQYKITRDAGKLVRRCETDVIQQFVTYAESQGSRHAKYYYASITSMVNRSLFTTQGKFKNLRNAMTVKQLMTVATAEEITEKALINGMALNKPYQEIYRDAKSSVSLLAGLHGQSVVIDVPLLSNASVTNRLQGA